MSLESEYVNVNEWIIGTEFSVMLLRKFGVAEVSCIFSLIYQWDAIFSQGQFKTFM